MDAVDIYNTAVMAGSPWFPDDRTVSAVVTIINSGNVDFGFLKPIGFSVPGGSNRWVMESAGPDCHWWNGSDPREYLYDPTNGTVSKGQLVLAEAGWICPQK